MAARLFMTTTSKGTPLDGSGDASVAPQVSDFLTVQSFTNFAAMTGGLSVAWQGLQTLSPRFGTKWVPFGLAVLFGIISIAISWDGLKKDNKLQFSAIAAACFIAFINALVLYGAVVGINVASE